MSESNGNAPEAHGQELPNGSRLQEFVVEATIGFGGFGITYLAHDTSLGRKVVIKEHLPDMFSFRDLASLTVRPRHTSGETMENYEWSIGSFMREAEMLASLEHPNIVKILRRFEANGTAYFVMPFVEGHSFDKVIAARQADGGWFTEKELREMLDPLLGAFAYLHALGIYHRDVKPGNILVTAAGGPVLIDFGAARQQVGEKSMTVVESAGYTPFEQTESRGNVGPWSDLYALGGVLRKAITFQTPARSADRIRRDPTVGLAGDPRWGDRYSGNFLDAVDRAMRVDEEARWQRAEDWLDELRKPMPLANDGTRLEGQPAPPPSHRTEASRSVHRTEAPRSVPLPKAATAPGPNLATAAGSTPRKKKSSKVGGLVAVLLCAGGAGFTAWYLLREKPAAAAESTPVSLNLSSPPSEMPFGVKPVSIIRAPDPAQWERLAGEGDGFAQALLGEGLVTGMAGMPKNTAGGLKWLAKAANDKYPLGVFLHAEQRMLRKEEMQVRSGGLVDLDKEREMFREAFELGFDKEPESRGAVWCAALGRAYHRGLGTAADPVKALRWLTIAGQAGHVGSQHLLGEIYETGRGVESDERDAARWYEMAANAGWPASQAAMARMCARGPDFFRDERKAFEWASLAAGADDPRGQAILGEFHEAGTGVTADAREAVRWYRLAAEKGDAVAKGRLGRMYLEGRGIEHNDREAFRLFKEAVNGGDTTACFALGCLYETGKGGEKDLSKAIKNYKAGAAAGDLPAKTALAICMEEGTGMSANPASAARLYEEASAKEIPAAQFRLGLLLLHGKGVKQNKNRAVGLLKDAADQGLPSARLEWGKCLEKGIGTARNESAAFEMYADAAKGGIAEAGFRAGLMSEEGRGTPKDEIAAMRYYRTAAEAGNANAQVNLGIMYAQGRGAARDDAQAVVLYRKAAGQGDTDGLVLLGMMCEFGQGTARSPQEAGRYYGKAADLGDINAKELLKKLKP